VPECRPLWVEQPAAPLAFASDAVEVGHDPDAVPSMGRSDMLSTQGFISPGSQVRVLSLLLGFFEGSLVRANFRANCSPMPRKLTLTVTPRPTAASCKRIDGEYVTWPDEETARAELVELIRRRSAGVAAARSGHARRSAAADIANAFRADRKKRSAARHVGRLRDRDRPVPRRVGKYRRVADLRPDDFAAVRAKWAAKLGPWKLDNRVQCVRTMFRWAHRTGRLIDREPWYGDAFSKTAPPTSAAFVASTPPSTGSESSPAELKKILGSAPGRCAPSCCSH
jgi:hypothetical protein